MNELFRKISRAVSLAVGRSSSFILAVLIVIVWACTGPLFGFSDTWQLVINTGTTILTFLMVFLIQNTQNRDAKAIHLKLDELIHSLKGARNSVVDIEEVSDAELEKMYKEFHEIHKEAMKRGMEHLKKSLR